MPPRPRKSVRTRRFDVSPQPKPLVGPPAEEYKDQSVTIFADQVKFLRQLDPTRKKVRHIVRQALWDYIFRSGIAVPPTVVDSYSTPASLPTEEEAFPFGADTPSPPPPPPPAVSEPVILWDTWEIVDDKYRGPLQIIYECLPSDVTMEPAIEVGRQQAVWFYCGNITRRGLVYLGPNFKSCSTEETGKNAVWKYEDKWGFISKKKVDVVFLFYGQQAREPGDLSDRGRCRDKWQGRRMERTRNIDLLVYPDGSTRPHYYRELYPTLCEENIRVLMDSQDLPLPAGKKYWIAG